MHKENKGFSLIELIIVIAIMAILVGIVGMTVIPYVEKAREAKDKTILGALCTNANSAWSFEAINISSMTNYTISTNSSNTTAVADTPLYNDDAIKLKEQLLIISGGKGEDNLWKYYMPLQSKMGKTIDTIVVTFNMTTHEIIVKTFNASGDKVFDDIENTPSI